MEKKEFILTPPDIKRSFTVDVAEFEYLLEMPLNAHVEFLFTEIKEPTLKEIVRLLNVKANGSAYLTARKLTSDLGCAVCRTDIKPKPRKKKKVAAHPS